MESAAHDFLKKLLQTPSPSGYEGPIREEVRKYAATFADEISTDLHGNVVLCRNPGQAVRVLMAGHCDQIGMLVSYIDETGFIYGQTIGGWDPQQLIGQRMTIWSKSRPIPAVIARRAIHLLDPEERKQVVKIKDLWLDIGAKSKEEASAMVRVGDPVTLQLGYQEMLNGNANAPGMDNKTGLWVVIEALRRAKDLTCSLYAVATVQEEIGLRGAKTSAFGIDPQVGIAVDVTHATDCPTIDKRQLGAINLGDGPVIFRGPNMNSIVTERLMDLATKNEIPFQRAALGRGASNDANAIQLTRGGVATGLVSIPNRYMHSAVETINLADIDNAAALLATFAGSLRGNEDFTP